MNRQKAAYAALFLLTLVTSGRASAQIVSIQSAISGEVPEGFGASGELRQEKKTGNTKLERFAAQATLTWQEERNLWLALLKRDYGNEGGSSTVDSSFYHLRYRYAILEWMGWELYGQEDSDRFRRRERRTVYGTGPSFRIVRNENFTLNYGLSRMEEIERVSADDLGLGREERRKGRLSHTLYARVRLHPHIELSDTFYFQPNLKWPGDRRLLNEVSLHLKVTDHLAFRLSHITQTDTSPPTGVEETDTQFLQALQLKI